MAEEVGSSVVGKVVDLLFGVVKKEISYIWNYTQNVEKFKNVLNNLKDMMARVQQQIDIANSKGDNLIVGVQEWVDKTCVKIFESETFLVKEANAKKTCFTFGMCGNWGNLHRYGKKATQMASFLLQLQENGKTFESGVSVYTRAPGPLDVFQNKNLDDIDTHKLVLGKVIEAIEDESIQIIGIYGLGGVGKTTLAKEVASKMKSHFADVAFTTLSQTLNVDKVKKDIENARKQIMQGKKILIILDDVWEKLNLEELCIPCGSKHMNCKILLTSRSEDVCRKMDVQSKICVDPLPFKETWILFKQVVGEKVDTDLTLKPVAMEVAEECGGLPLLVQAVGNALKGKDIDSWKSALTQLKKPARSDIDLDIKKAYIHLQLSYDYLHSDEAKSCFLMCCMFPEDQLISLEHLVYYGVGLAKFKDLESLNDARGRVQNAVNILTSSSLLLNVDYEKKTKMHDVVRDVALLIASEGNNKFLVKTGKCWSGWLPRNNTYELYTGISYVGDKMCKLPDNELHLPNHKTFPIPGNDLSTIYNEFFGGMKGVRVLDMSWNNISKLPQSLKLLTPLRMLNLAENRNLREISILGELKDLEILILSLTGIKEIPQEIGQLVKLRRFSVSNCVHLCHISPGVLLKLCWLEELCIGFYSMQDDGIHDRLVEVMKLSKLTYLDLNVPYSDVIPKGFNWGKLNGFFIQIGGYITGTLSSVSERHLVVSCNRLKDPNISLESIRNFNNILRDLYHKGFNKFESIKLESCPNVRCLVDIRNWNELQTDHLGDEEVKPERKLYMKLKHLELKNLENMEVVWKCPDAYISLTNLLTMNIEHCQGLVRGVFSVSVAQGLVSLQELRIINCPILEEVIWGGDDKETDDRTSENAANIIVFPRLSKISFDFLISLKSFCSRNSTITYPSLVQVNIVNCESMEKWCNGIQETPNLKFVDYNEYQVPLDGPYAINDAVMKSLRT